MRLEGRMTDHRLPVDRRCACAVDWWSAGC